MNNKNIVVFNDISYKKKKKKKFYLKKALPWVEKYRPAVIDEILLHPYIKIKFDYIIKTNELPNLIITGEPGTGKTSSILCLAKQLIRKKYYSEYVLELNASDDRGLSLINNTIIHFCKKKASSVCCKIVILDEADSITSKAQNLLNNILEEYTNTKFIFICNDSSKITEAIQSRCLIIRFPRLEKKSIRKKIISICEKENITYTEKGINTLISSSRGDIRQVINSLECIGLTLKKITPETVLFICDKPKQELINNILKTCLQNNLKKAIKLTHNLITLGYSPNDIFSYIMNMIIYNDIDILTQKQKLLCMNELSNYYIKSTDSNESNLQLSSCIVNICNKLATSSI